MMGIWNSSLARRLFMLKCMREKKAAKLLVVVIVGSTFGTRSAIYATLGYCFQCRALQSFQCQTTVVAYSEGSASVQFYLD